MQLLVCVDWGLESERSKRTKYQFFKQAVIGSNETVFFSMSRVPKWPFRDFHHSLTDENTLRNPFFHHIERITFLSAAPNAFAIHPRGVADRAGIPFACA